MKKIYYFLALITASSLFSCTDVLLISEQHDKINARSMEFGVDLQCDFAMYPSGYTFKPTVFGNHLGKSWKVKYPYLGVRVFHSDVLCDGMNSEGLSLGVLWFPPAKYPSNNYKDPSHTIPFEYLAHWILGKFRTTDEVKASISKLHLWFHSIAHFNGVPPLHFSVHDNRGKSLVIEFSDGKMNLYDNQVGVLTNAPEYPWHVTNLSNYISLDPNNKKPLSMDGSVLDPTGQGTGLTGLPGDWTPPSRFVKIAFSKQYLATPKSSKETINAGWHLMNTVDIPKGLVRSSEGKDSDYTQWVVVKDLTNLNLQYRSYGTLQIHSLSLRELLQNNNKVKILPMKP